MPKLTKVASGLLFYDDFSEKTLMWTLSPSDANCLSFGERGLQIKHNKRYVSYTIVEPNLEEYSCIVHLDHIPVNRNDYAGILIMSESKEYAECQSFLASGPSELINSDQYEVDVKNLIQDILNDDNSYVRWTENDDELNFENSHGTVTNTTDRKPGEPVDESGPFIDVYYHYIKFTKIKYKYIFWASTDGLSWIEIGNVCFENSGVIGFFLYGTTEKEVLTYSHCFFKSFALYNSKYITIQGISRQYDCEITDKFGNVILRTDDISFSQILNRSNTQILIYTAMSPMPIYDGQLRIYPKGHYPDTITVFNMGPATYGGDIFTIEKDIRVFINNVEISTSELYDLGLFYRGSYFIKFDVHNFEEYGVDCVVSVIKYSEYYGGELPVEIAIFKDDVPTSELEFSHTLNIESIPASEGITLVMKLTDDLSQDFYGVANDYRFKILIE